MLTYFSDASQTEAFHSFNDSIQDVVVEKQRLQQAVHDAKRSWTRMVSQVKSMDNEVNNNQTMRDEALNALKAAEDKLAFSSQVSPGARYHNRTCLYYFLIYATQSDSQSKCACDEHLYNALIDVPLVRLQPAVAVAAWGMSQMRWYLCAFKGQSCSRA